MMFPTLAAHDLHYDKVFGNIFGQAGKNAGIFRSVSVSLTALYYIIFFIPILNPNAT